MSSMNKDIKKIAIVRLSALGDIVNSAVVLQFINAEYPEAKIEWITQNGFDTIIKEHPLLDKVHAIDIKKIKKEKNFTLLKETISRLRSLGEFDLIIDMQGLLKSAIVSRLIGKKTQGFDKHSTRESLASLFYKTTSNIPYETCVIKRNCFVVSDALDFLITDTMLLNKKPIFSVDKHFEFKTQKKKVALVIAASWESKIYPKELVAQVCNALKTQLYIIWGSQEEKKNAEWICENSEYATLAPKLSLSELVSFISHMDLLIGNDTGPTHMAWAQNIPSITLFGPTNERMIYVTPSNIAIQSSSKVDILKINKNDFSIKDIPYEEIVQKAEELLK